MKIVHLLKHAVRGNGSVHVAVDLACEQADQGHEVVFASARGSYDDLLRSHGVRVIELPEPVDRRSALRNLVALIRLLRTVRPHVVHAHMMSSAVLGFLAVRFAGAALVTTVHNSFDRHSGLMRLGKRVVAVSEAERRLLIGRGFPARRLFTVLNGVGGSARESLPLDPTAPLETPCVLVVAGLHPRKGVSDVIEAFAEVAPDYPDWRLNIVGWGPDRDELEARAAGLGLASSVHFLGSTLTPLPLMRQAQIFATGSLADPCPLNVIEARLSGCAIVGTSVGGIPEILEQGEAGSLVPPRDPAAMAAVLRDYMSSSDTLEQWRRLAHAGAAQKFSVRRMADDYRHVYEGLVKPAQR